MEKWTQKELFCNSRGLDDGYVFFHKDNPLSKETEFILDSKDKYTKEKFRLAEKDIAKTSCFFGLLRKPLSNELYDRGEDSSIPLPATSNRISHSSEVFSDPIEPNQAACFAFTEPEIKHHRSEILRDAVLPPSILTDEDRRIRRPRLNRGGDTISNLGGGNSSHKSGYGSMNISSYERDLATKTGRGRQMNQAGTRSWGSMEPTPKRFHGGHHSVQRQAPTMQRWQAPPPAFPPPPPHPTQQWQPPPQQYSQGYQQQQQYNANAGAYNQQTMSAMSGYGYNQGQQQQWRGNNAYPNQQHQQRSNGNGVNNHTRFQQPSQNQGGYAFNQQGQQRQMPQHQRQQQQAQSNSSFNRPGAQQQQQQQPQSGGRANLNNLRAQLMSTLQKQRKGN